MNRKDVHCFVGEQYHTSLGHGGIRYESCGLEKPELFKRIASLTVWI